LAQAILAKAVLLLSSEKKVVPKSTYLISRSLVGTS